MVWLAREKWIVSCTNNIKVAVYQELSQTKKYEYYITFRACAVCAFELILTLWMKDLKEIYCVN